MIKTIGDLKKGQLFKTHEGTSCQVITPTKDAKGLVAKYIEGDAIGQEDFIFETEIELQET